MTLLSNLGCTRWLLCVGVLLCSYSASFTEPAAAAEEAEAEESVRADVLDVETHLIDVETRRIDAACAAIPTLNCATTPREIAWEFVPDSGAPRQPNYLIAQTDNRGAALWRRAQRTVDTQGRVSVPDDRWLYWQRLRALRDLSEHCGATAACLAAAKRFEHASRGGLDLGFNQQTHLRILVTGFDPFGLHNHIDQSNPSGVAALALDGLVISHNGVTAELQTAMFPVRFADFDAGMVEDLIEPLLRDSSIDALVTISMGRDGFDLERFPGRRRSSTAPDNLLIKTGANSSNPLVPTLRGQPLSGAEFVEFSLPATAMLEVQKPYPVRDNRSVETLENGRFDAQSLQQLTPLTAVNGSGGGYLSNEISYRTLRLVKASGRPIPAGHIHTPRITGADGHATQAMTQQIRQLLEAALPAIAEFKAEHPQ